MAHFCISFIRFDIVADFACYTVNHWKSASAMKEQPPQRNEDFSCVHVCVYVCTDSSIGNRELTDSSIEASRSKINTDEIVKLRYRLLGSVYFGISDFTSR